MDYMQPQTAKKTQNKNSPLQKPQSEYPSNKQMQWSESKKIQTFLTTAQPQRPETSKYEKTKMQNQQFFDTTPTKNQLSQTEMNQKI